MNGETRKFTDEERVHCFISHHVIAMCMWTQHLSRDDGNTKLPPGSWSHIILVWMWRWLIANSWQPVFAADSHEYQVSCQDGVQAPREEESPTVFSRKVDFGSFVMVCDFPAPINTCPRYSCAEVTNPRTRDRHARGKEIAITERVYISRDVASPGRRSDGGPVRQRK